MSNYRLGVLGGMGPSSSRASYPSLPAEAESSLIPPLLLSKSNPLRWASIWGLRPLRI